MPPFNGSGQFDVFTPGNPRVAGTTITSSVINSTNTDFATGLTNAITRDGQSPPTADLPMGGNNHTNVGAATVRTEYARADQVQDASTVWLTAVAGTNTITATAPLSMSAYTAGQMFRFIPAVSNTGAATINLNGIGAKSITKNGILALEAGDMISNQIQTIIYDGTQFQLISPLRMRAGTYTGDGTTGQTVLGCGFIPKALMIILSAADGVASIIGITTSTLIARDAQGLGAFLSTGAVTNLDNRFVQMESGGFTVSDDGTDVFPNTNGQVYDFIAWG